MPFSPLSAIQNSLDKYGLIVDANGDGGDTCQREGMFAFAGGLLHKRGIITDQELLHIKNRYIYALTVLECHNCPGTLMRNPDPDKYWSDCGGLEHPLKPWLWTSRGSRDQTLPHIAALGILDMKGHLQRLLKAQAKRLFIFMTNTRHNGVYMNKEEHLLKSPNDPWEPQWKMPDILGFSAFAMFVRSFNLWILYPLVMILDLEMLVNACLKTFYYAKNPDKSDDVNFVVDVMWAQERFPTPLSYLAKKIYARRPLPNPPPLTGRYLSDFGPQAALDHYFMRSPVPMSPLNHIYRLLTNSLKD